MLSSHRHEWHEKEKHSLCSLRLQPKAEFQKRPDKHPTTRLGVVYFYAANARYSLKLYNY